MTGLLLESAGHVQELAMAFQAGAMAGNRG